ncbi:MAG: hypothetical protein H7Y16_03665, partial [Candidatus Parcubacteria bacterium]|nr:hypothetical protein [Burkholderiales bacterium]
MGGLAAWDRALLRGRRSPGAVMLTPSGPATLVLRDGTTLSVQAVGGIGVTRHWVALAQRRVAGRGLLVAAGMLRPSDLRLLRLWALWGRVPGVASGQRAT